jgi:vacuolar protein sorting-associated protein 51
MTSFKDDLSDDSSDDEFLTPGHKGDSRDREAIIRRKLMESFYGKSLSPEKEKNEVKDASLDKVDNDLIQDEGLENVEEENLDEDINMMSDDLDSPYFDPDAHTSKYVLHANVHDVLEVEERLALQVRTLDSTMQTLVYENYSKFIDATDAIRSIGVSVNANEEGLEKLSSGIQIIDETSRCVEDALGTLRDAVAEKLRIKRLLTRLDGLLKLPSTLKHQILQGQYRLATKSYISAHAILSKHSAGFESLKIIEADCRSILEKMIQDLKHKLLHWSGQTALPLRNVPSIDEDDVNSLNESDAEHEILKESPLEEKTDSDWIPPPEPPKSVGEILECASTLLIALPKTSRDDDMANSQNFVIQAPACKASSLTATIRYLERVLDSHQIELNDAMFQTEFVQDKFDGTGITISSDLGAGKHSTLIPTNYLDSILEAATLYGISFSNDGVPVVGDSDRHLLMDFVSDAFSAFLSYVRSLLLERSSSDEDEDEEKDTIAGDSDEAFFEISSAMKEFLRAVRDLASGLALPDVGFDVAFSSGLVDQAIEVTETMVRRRVAQKFFKLRHNVVQECMFPFATEAIKHVNSSETPRVIEIVQMASVALSDTLQLVDDTVKSILTGGVVVSDLKGVDYAMVKAAVQGCCRGFGLWLAATLEILGGCENSDRKCTIDIETKSDDGFEEFTRDDKVLDITVNTPDDDVSEMKQVSVHERIDCSLNELMKEIENSSSPETRSDLILSLCEMCRLAQRSVMESINQSISAEYIGARKHNRNSDIFVSSAASQRQKTLNELDAKVSDRFLLAASRLVSLYSLNRGFEAERLVCLDLFESAKQDGEDVPLCPRAAVIDFLHVVKVTSIDCAHVFGGEKCAGPVPDPLQDERDLLNTSGSSFRSKSLTSGLTSVKGLSLDVERMFTLKIDAFPHPNHLMTFSRNLVVFTVLNVACKGIMEHVRNCIFYTKGYRQLQIDILLLRYLLPHYVSDDTSGEGTNYLTVLENTLNDVMHNAGERCRDLDCLQQTKFYDPTNGEWKTLQSIIRNFMAKVKTSNQEDLTSSSSASFIIEADMDMK